MLIGVRKRFIFVANTKAASTAIERALMPYAEIHRGGSPAQKHIALHDVLAEYDFLFGQPGQAPERFFKFGVMREPIDWIGSWFRYRKGNEVESPLPAEMSLAEFWARGDWNIIRRDGRRHLQRDRFTAPDGTMLADMIIPYHELDAYLPAITAHLGVPGRLDRLNVSRITPDDAPIPDTLRAEMRDFYAADYALWEQLEAINAQGMETLKATRPLKAHGADRKPQP